MKKKFKDILEIKRVLKRQENYNKISSEKQVAKQMQATIDLTIDFMY